MHLAGPWARGPLLGAIVLGLWAPGARAADVFAPLSDAEVARIDRNEIIVQIERTDDAVKHFRAVGLVAAPAARVFATFTDFEHYPSIFKIKDSRVLSRRDNALMVRATMTFVWPVGEKWVTNQTVISPTGGMFTFRRTDGNIPEYEGQVDVVARTPSTSMVRYAARVDPGIPGVPSWVVNYFQAIYLPDSIKRVRQYLGVGS